MTRLQSVLVAAAVAVVGCDSPQVDAVAEIRGAQYLTFRCVQSDGDELVGLPLDGCGCTERTADGYRRLGRIECTCRTVDADGDRGVDDVRAERVAGALGLVPIRGEDGDWIEATGDELSVPCDARGSGNIRGYVGATDRGEVAVLDVDDDHDVIDVDDQIPGITSVFVDDLVTDVGAHPDGDFVFTVDSTSGRLTVIREESVRQTETYDLRAGPLGQVVVWPPAARPSPEPADDYRAFIAAPTEGAVVAVDLNALGGGELLIAERYQLPGRARPGALAIDPDGATLFVAHAGASKVSVFAIDDPAPRALIDLVSRQPCANGYLDRVIAPEDDDTCTDGIDNNLDGAIDADDAECARIDSEATPPASPALETGACAKLPECFDGIDNDGDALVDAEDEDCDPAACPGGDCRVFLDWERPVPECANGVDDDGDGNADAADDGCTSEADPVEGAAREGVGDCDDGADNDGDGLTDGEDPGCNDAFSGHLRYRFERRAECAPPDREGEVVTDDDADGLADYPNDPECYAASDRSEAGAGVEVGPASMVAARVELPEGPRAFLYVVDATGALLSVDLNDLDACIRTPDVATGCTPMRRARRLNLDTTVLSMALRNPRADVASLLVAGADASLRSIEITAPLPVLTDTGHDVFAKFDGENPITQVKLLDQLYYVVEGVAMSLPSTTEALTEFLEGGTYTYVEGHLDLPVPSVVSTEGSVAIDVAVRPGAPTYERGRLDPQVFKADRVFHVTNAEANVLRTAQSRNARVTAAPRFLVRSSTARFDVARHPALCRLPQPVTATEDMPADPPAESDAPPPECVPVGFTETGDLEDPADAAARTASRVDTYEGITVIARQPVTLRSDIYTLAYEGEIPRSDSRTGVYGERLGDDSWTLLDHDVDFCRTGVEVGDMLLVDFFVPAAEGYTPPGSDVALTAEQLEARCAAFELTNANADPNVNREPLRWVVASRTAHKLELVRDERVDYTPQLPPDERSVLPRLAAPPSAPPPECAAELISYRVRAGNDQWILSGRLNGYRHPFVNDEGQCQPHPRYVADRRFGRARLGEDFENEAFRFRLGALAETEASDGVPAGALPFMVDVAFEFEFQRGIANERLPDAAILPGEMVWLPSDDRVYIVDTAQRTVVEVAGLDVFTTRMSLIRRLR